MEPIPDIQPPSIFAPIIEANEQQREGWTDRPTPETDLEEATQTQRFGGYMVKSAFARKLERERDEARGALSGRTVSCSRCNDTAKQIAALREALEKALALHKAITTYDTTQSLADREANEQHCAMMEKALSQVTDK